MHSYEYPLPPKVGIGILLAILDLPMVTGVPIQAGNVISNQIRARQISSR